MNEKEKTTMLFYVKNLVRNGEMDEFEAAMFLTAEGFYDTPESKTINYFEEEE